MFNSGCELPVFIQPQEIIVVRSNVKSHRNCLTLINPFDFILHYKILSNAPSNFKVQEPNGYLKPKCVADMQSCEAFITKCAGFGRLFASRGVQRRKSSGSQKIITNSFKRSVQVCGHKDIKVHVVNAEVRRQPTVDDFHSFPGSSARSGRSRTHSSFAVEPQNQGLFWFAIVICCISILTVLMPTHTTENPRPSIVPHWLHPTQNLQLVAAYSLGIITIYLIRQNN
ncbi:Major sperm protein [Aphelenchoides bicaudatus]|nr:Major sperm protein [Aphelenchoides bicaudatus]